jgi:hypothetical protein
MSDVPAPQVTAHHALLTTVVALIVALLVGAGAVVLYYEVIDSDIVLDTPAPVVQVITPEQVAAARAIDKHEAERIVVTPTMRTDKDAPTSSLAGVPARVESMGRIPVDKK